MKELADGEQIVWSEEGMPHYRLVKCNLVINLPEKCRYTDANGNIFEGSQFLGEVQFLMDSYVFAKRETHKYYKVKRARTLADYRQLRLWENPHDQKKRKQREEKSKKQRERRAKLLSENDGVQRLWKEIRQEAEALAKQKGNWKISFHDSTG